MVGFEFGSRPTFPLVRQAGYNAGMKFQRPSNDFWVAIALVPVVLAVIFTGAFLLAFTAMGAAFTVWLVVRIVNRRERWATRTAAAMIALSVMYPLSFGPAHWYVNSRPLQMQSVVGIMWFYSPLHSAARRSPVIERSILSYVELWSPRNPFVHFQSKLVIPGQKQEAVPPW